MRKAVMLLTVAVLAGLSSVGWSAGAGQAGAARPQPVAADDEEQFDEKLRQFGYWSGAAMQCVPEARAAETEREVIGAFNRISQLFGTDRAFLFAAAFGNGTSRQVDKAKCPEFLKKFQESTLVRGAGK